MRKLERQIEAEKRLFLQHRTPTPSKTDWLRPQLRDLAPSQQRPTRSRMGLLLHVKRLPTGLPPPRKVDVLKPIANISSSRLTVGKDGCEAAEYAGLSRVRSCRRTAVSRLIEGKTRGFAAGCKSGGSNTNPDIVIRDSASGRGRKQDEMIFDRATKLRL